MILLFSYETVIDGIWAAERVVREPAGSIVHETSRVERGRFPPKCVLSGTRAPAGARPGVALAAGGAGALLLPFFTMLTGLVALFKEFTIVVERHDTGVTKPE